MTHFQRQVNGTNSSSSGKISRRPSSMQIMSTILLRGEKTAKLPVGPTRERPGPMFYRQESEDVKFVVKYSPSSDTSRPASSRMMI